MDSEAQSSTDWEAITVFPSEAHAEAILQGEDDFCMWPICSGQLHEVLRKVARAPYSPEDIYMRVDDGPWRYLRTVVVGQG